MLSNNDSLYVQPSHTNGSYMSDRQKSRKAKVVGSGLGISSLCENLHNR